MSECILCHVDVTASNRAGGIPEDAPRDLCQDCEVETALGVNATEEVEVLFSEEEAAALRDGAREAGLPSDGLVRVLLTRAIATGEADRRLGESAEYPLDTEEVSAVIDRALGLGEGGEAA